MLAIFSNPPYLTKTRWENGPRQNNFGVIIYSVKIRDTGAHSVLPMNLKSHLHGQVSYDRDWTWLCSPTFLTAPVTISATLIAWQLTPALIYSICELLLVFTWTIEDSDLNYVGLKHIYRGLFTFLQSSMPWQNISLTFLSFVSWHLVMVPPLVMQHSSTNPLASDRPTRSICSSGRSMDIIQHFHYQNKSRISWLCSNKQFAISAARSVFIRLTQMMFAWEGMGGAAAICRANLHSRV